MSTNWATGVRFAFLKTDSNNFFLNFCMGNLNPSDLALFHFIWLNILERTREQKQNRLHRLSINCISSQTKSLRLFWFCPIVLFNNKGIKGLAFFHHILLSRCLRKRKKNLTAIYFSILGLRFLIIISKRFLWDSKLRKSRKGRHVFLSKTVWQVWQKNVMRER